MEQKKQKKQNSIAHLVYIDPKYSILGVIVLNLSTSSTTSIIRPALDTLHWNEKLWSGVNKKIKQLWLQVKPAGWVIWHVKHCSLVDVENYFAASYCHKYCLQKNTQHTQTDTLLILPGPTTELTECIINK